MPRLAARVMWHGMMRSDNGAARIAHLECKAHGVPYRVPQPFQCYCSGASAVQQRARAPSLECISLPESQRAVCTPF